MDSALITMDTKVEPTPLQVCPSQPICAPADKRNLQAKKPFPIIPVEIVAKILNNLRNDKHTLAQCMRVSPAFNYAAAPLIYHTVKLDEDNVIGFFSFPWNSYKVQDIRKTKSKAYHLATMVRSFDCSVRDLAYCEIASRNYHSDMLCVRTPVWRAYLEASTRVQRGTIPYARVDRAPQRVLPAKLICHGPGINDSRCILRNLYPGLKSLVMVGEIWKTARQLSPPISMLSSQSLDRLTLIHWSDWSATHRLSYDLSSFDDMPDIQHNTPKAWETFQKDILKAAQIANFPTDIIIVNMESKAVLEVKSPDLAKAATEATQEAYIKSIPEFAGKDRKKTTEQAQNVRIKFVSMRTYLDEYEWKGELTERQVKPWMDIQMDMEGREVRTQRASGARPRCGWGVY